MNILIAATHLKLYGDGLSHYALTLAQGLQERGHQIWLASSNPVPQQKLEEMQVHHLIMPLDQYQKNLSNFTKSFRYIRHLAQQEQLDLVHSLHRWIGFISHYTLWGLPTKLIATDQNILLGKRLLTHWGDHVISVSETGRNHLIEYFGVPPHKISVIYNAVDVLSPSSSQIQQARQDFNISNNDRVLVNVARLDPQKGQEYLLQAMPPIIDRWPQVKLIIVGDGSLEKNLKQLATSLNLDSNIIFAGIRSDIPAILANANIFVLSSLWEGLPFALLEAMYLGLPAISTNVGGVPEVISDSETGFLVEPASVNDLTSKITTALENDVLCQKVAKAGQLKVQEQFRAETMITETETIYRQVCGSR